MEEDVLLHNVFSAARNITFDSSLLKEKGGDVHFIAARQSHNIFFFRYVPSVTAALEIEIIAVSLL